MLPDIVKEAIEYYISLEEKLASHERAEMGSGKTYSDKADILKKWLSENV